MSSAPASPGGPAAVNIPLNKATQLCEVEDLIQVDLARVQAAEEKQERLEKLYVKNTRYYLLNKDEKELDSCPVIRGADGIFKTLRSDQDGHQATTQQELDNQISTAAKVTIVDADGECFLIIEKAGIATRLSNSMAYRRARSRGNLYPSFARKDCNIF